MNFSVSFVPMDHRLLLIDDAPALLTAFSGMMAWYFSSVTATAVASGAEAVQAVQQQEYDIVICDLLMPGMDGAMTLTELRKKHPCLRMYLMTGHPRPEEVYKATPAHGFIKKPLERAYFLDFMQRTIHVISVGKRVASKVMRTNEYLSSVGRRHAVVGKASTCAGPLHNPCSL
jgi:CheY-like chemotaxis protein